MSYIITAVLLLCLPVALAALYTVKTGKNINLNKKGIKLTTKINKKSNGDNKQDLK